MFGVYRIGVIQKKTAHLCDIFGVKPGLSELLNSMITGILRLYCLFPLVGLKIAEWIDRSSV